MKINELKKIIIVLFLYFSLFAVFSMKTIYYYQNHSVWWLYALIISICFIYFVYHCKSNKKHSNYLMISLVALFSLFPLEVELTKLYDLIWGAGIELSGLGLKFSNKFAGTTFDLLFFPFLIFIPMYFTKLTYKKE